MTRPVQHGGRGFTLVEALLAAAILAMAITAIVMPFTAGAQNEQSDARRILSASLAQEMMEEILTTPFYDPSGFFVPGPDADETSRALYDAIDDYHGHDEWEGQIASIEGEVIHDSAAVGLSRHVTTQYTYVSGQDPGEDPTFISVSVAVRYRGNPVITLRRLVYAMP